jgi:hypothetical protein
MTMMLFDDRSLPQNKSGVITNWSPGQIEGFFNKFWEIYPKRRGNNPKFDASKRFAKLVHSGDNPETIIAGVHRFAAECGTNRIVGTCFVPQAIRWLNGKMWLNDPDAGPGGEPKSFLDIARDLRERASEAEPGECG